MGRPQSDSGPNGYLTEPSSKKPTVTSPSRTERGILPLLSSSLFSSPSSLHSPSPFSSPLLCDLCEAPGNAFSFRYLSIATCCKKSPETPPLTRPLAAVSRNPYSSRASCSRSPKHSASPTYCSRFLKPFLVPGLVLFIILINLVIVILKWVLGFVWDAQFRCWNHALVIDDWF